MEARHRFEILGEGVPAAPAPGLPSEEVYRREAARQAVGVGCLSRNWLKGVRRGRRIVQIGEARKIREAGDSMTATLQEAQADLAGIIHRLTPGEELTLTQNETVVATLKAGPTAATPRKRPPPGLWKGKVTIVSDVEEHLKDFAEYMP